MFLDDTDIKTVELLPKESKEIEVKVTLPSDAEKKDYEGLVIFAVGQQKRAAKVKVYAGSFNVIEYFMNMYNSIVSLSPNGFDVGDKVLPSDRVLPLIFLSGSILIILFFTFRKKKRKARKYKNL